ncbi:hypothetical protein DPMN_146364 [Dreissena polymorpha]|uniref:Uncharacterized protein n=1 Tax=Dreissena polymorpha TaxID=45954 RepID=A0A9D4F5S7_DREPO|nr:hypothetical protein DPMN_146364 [Dreissena polymorpha]
MYPKCETQYCKVVYDQGPSVKLSDSVAEFYRAAVLQPDDLWRGVTTHRTSQHHSLCNSDRLVARLREGLWRSCKENSLHE